MPDIVVIGAGLSGLSCAYNLTEARRDVLVLEARSVVGGRTSSWEEDGMPVESGLHRWLGFYKHLPRLLRGCGVSVGDILCWENEMEVMVPDGGPRAVIGMAPVFKPAKTIAGLVGNNDLLSPRSKMKLVRFMAAGMRDYVRRPDELEKTTVLEYARAHGVPDQAIENLLVPLTAGIFFLHPDRYSAFGFFGLLAPGVPRLHRMRLGAFMGGMTDVMCRPIAEAVERRGGRVRTSAEVTSLIVERGSVQGVTVDDEEIRAPHVVLAASLAPAQRLIKAHFPGEGWFEPMLAMPSMPVVTIQMELDRPSMGVDRTSFGPGTVMASFAEQSRTTFRHAPGRLSVILAPPEPFMDMPDEDVFQQTLEDAARLGLDIADHVTRYRVIRLPMDFYSLEPGNHLRRPSQRTPVPGLTLAGDYTRQRYLGSMEGAVVSGELAAAAVQEG